MKTLQSRRYQLYRAPLHERNMRAVETAAVKTEYTEDMYRRPAVVTGHG